MNQKNNCPAIKDWWDSSTFRPFYLIPQGNVRVIADPASPLVPASFPGSEEAVLYEERIWLPSGIDMEWTPGPMSEPWPEYTFEADHWHTSFEIRNHVIHIDFISFFRGGPQTTYREYRVFCDGVELKRGGGYMGYLMTTFTRQRNWPLAVEIDDHLIYLKYFIHSWLPISKEKFFDQIPGRILVSAFT